MFDVFGEKGINLQNFRIIQEILLKLQKSPAPPVLLGNCKNNIYMTMVNKM